MFSICFVFGSIVVFAQDLPALKLTDVSIQPFVMGGSFERAFLASDIEFFTDNTDALQMEDWFENYFHYGLNSNIGMNIAAGFELRSKDKSFYRENPLIRIGLQGSSLNFFSFSGQETTTSAFDTLTSAQTNQAYYLDSVQERYYSVNKRAQLISIDASMIFRTDTEKKWSLYGGAGLTAGVSLNAYTEMTGHTNNYIQQRLSNNQTNRLGHSSFGNTHQQFRYANKMNIMGTLYVPLGINVNLGCTSDFWSKINLFYEFRSGLTFVNVPESKNLGGFSFLHGLGLSISIR